MRGCPHLVLVAATIAIPIFVSLACGTDPVGVESCQKIEKVRCESAIACGIDLGRPTATNDNTPEQQVASCIRYYDDQCLHGLAGPTEDPGPQVVDACVDAIIKGDCTVVKQPESHPACAFLIPPAPPPATPAPPADAATDG